MRSFALCNHSLLLAHSLVLIIMQADWKPLSDNLARRFSPLPYRSFLSLELQRTPAKTLYPRLAVGEYEFGLARGSRISQKATDAPPSVLPPANTGFQFFNQLNPCPCKHGGGKHAKQHAPNIETPFRAKVNTTPEKQCKVDGQPRPPKTVVQSH